MQAYESPTSLDIGLERGFFFGAQITRVAFVNDDNIGVSQIVGGGGVERSIDDGAVLGEQLAPVAEELGIVVLAGLMRFESGPDVDVHAVRVLSPGTGRRGRLRDDGGSRSAE